MQAPTSRSSLLALLEPLSYAARWSYMVSFGRAQQRQPAGHALLGELAASPSAYERHLAAQGIRGVFASLGSHRGRAASATASAADLPPALHAHSRRLVLDPQPRIARVVMAMVAEYSSEHELRETIAVLPHKQLAPLCAALKRCGREEVIGTAVAAGWVDDAARKREVLIGCLSEKGVMQLTTGQILALEEKTIAVLARQHTQWMVKRLRGEVQAALVLPQPPPNVHKPPAHDTRDSAAGLSPTAEMTTAAQREKERDIAGLCRLMQVTGPEDPTAVVPTLPPLLERCVAIALESLVRGSRAQFEAAAPLCEATLHHFAEELPRRERILTRLLQRRARDTATYIAAHYRELAPFRIALSRGVREDLREDSALILRLLALDALETARVGEHGIAQLYPVLPPTVRRHLFREQRAQLLLQDGRLPLEVLEAIPDENDRLAEARLNFEHPSIAGMPHEQVQYLRVLRVDEISELAPDMIQNPDVNQRIAVIVAMLRGATYHDSDNLTRLLEFALKRVREQDPWRVSFFTGLAWIPPSLWQSAHLPMLTTLIHAAHNAKDVSNNTRYRLARAVERIPADTSRPGASPHTDYLVGFLQKQITAQANNSGVDRVELKHLSPATQRAVFTALIPVMKRLIDEAATTAFHVIRSVDAREGGVLHAAERAALKELLVRAVTQRDVRTASSGMNIFLKEFPQDAVAMLPDMLRKEADWITQGDMAAFVLRHLNAESVIAPYLSLLDLKGRFWRFKPKKKMDLIFMFPTEGLYRLTEAQQRRYASTLLRGVEACQADHVYQIPQYLTTYAALPSITADDGLRPFTALDFSTYTRDLALLACGRMRDDASLQILKDALLDDRAVEAITRIGSRVRFLPVDVALDVLAPAAACPRITVQKELVRLAGDLQGEASYRFLMKFVAARRHPSSPAAPSPSSSSEASDAEEAPATGLHRDVEVALLRVLWGYLEKEEVWDHFFDVAARAPRMALVVAACNVPYARLRSDTSIRRYHAMLTTVLRRRDDAVLISSGLRTLSRLTLRASDPALEATLYDLFPAKVVLQNRYLSALLLRALLALPSFSASHAARVIADIPDERQLHLIASDVVLAVNAVPATTTRPRLRVLRALGQLLAARLASRGVLPRDAVGLVLTCAAPSTWPAVVRELQSRGLMHPDAAVAAVEAVGEKRMTSLWKPEDLFAVEPVLRAEAQSELLRRMGLELLTLRATREGWHEPLRHVLERCYKTDPSLWVSGTAKQVELPQE